MATTFEFRVKRFLAEGWLGRQQNWECWLSDSILFAVTAANDRRGAPDGRIDDALVIAYGNALMRRELARVPDGAMLADAAVCITEAVTQITAQLLAVTDLYGHMQGVVDAAKTAGDSGGGG